MFVVIGAFLGGLFLILKELLPWLEAKRTGVIHTRGHRRVKVGKAVDPERFQGLCRQRVRSMGLGLIVIAFGFGWLVWPTLLQILLLPFQPPA